jgi:hypothetical protein
MVTAHPDRFSAFATLPVTVPEEAAAELERAVRELGFVGTMISGTIGGRFLDDPVFLPILETAARLDVPIYLHPAPPPQPVAAVYYRGFSDQVNQVLATGGYGWHYETSVHALRMILGGVFDRLPGLKVIIGHRGEGSRSTCRASTARSPRRPPGWPDRSAPTSGSTSGSRRAATSTTARSGRRGRPSGTNG